MNSIKTILTITFCVYGMFKTSNAQEPGSEIGSPKWQIGIEGNTFVMPNMINSYAGGTVDKPGLGANVVFSRRLNEKLRFHTEIGYYHATFYRYHYEIFPKKIHTTYAYNFINFLPLYLQYDLAKQNDVNWFIRGGLRTDYFIHYYLPVYTSLVIGCRYQKFIFALNFMRHSISRKGLFSAIDEWGRRYDDPIFRKPPDVFRNYWGLTVGYNFYTK